MAAGALDARTDGGAAPGGGGAAAAGAIEPGGHRPAARGEWRERVPLGGDAGAGGPPRLAGAWAGCWRGGRWRPASRPSNGPCGASRRWSGASSGWPTTRATWSGRCRRSAFRCNARPPGRGSAMSARSPPGRAAAGSPSKQRASREGRTIVFLDETGHSFRARPGTTWARRGATPVLRRLSKRREVSSVVAVTPAGRLYARHVRGSVSSRVVIRALRHFRRKIGRPLMVVWDRLNAHRARRTAAFLARHARDFAVAYLPAYAPDLNPEEPCNAWVKRIMENALPRDVAELGQLVRRAFRRLQHRPDFIIGCFRHAGLRITRLP